MFIANTQSLVTENIQQNLNKIIDITQFQDPQMRELYATELGTKLAGN